MGGPAYVLVADDDEAMRSMLSTSLRRRGLVVDECADGRELLERLQVLRERSRRLGLVVSDIRMPGPNGLDVVHWIARCLPDVPVILITSFGDEQTHRRAKALGAVAVIDKPFDLEELQDHVTRAMDPDA